MRIESKYLFQEICKEFDEFQKPLPYSYWKTSDVGGLSFSRISGSSCPGKLKVLQSTIQ